MPLNIPVLGTKKDVKRIRKWQGSWDSDGDYIEGAKTETTHDAALQPAGGSTIERLPEGLKERAEWLAFVDITVDYRTIDNHDKKKADLMEVDGEEYQVTRVADYSHANNLPHQELVLLRKEDK